MPMEYIDIGTGQSSAQKSYEELAKDNELLRKNLQDIDAVILSIIMGQSPAGTSGLFGGGEE